MNKPLIYLAWFRLWAAPEPFLQSAWPAINSVAFYVQVACGPSTEVAVPKRFPIHKSTTNTQKWANIIADDIQNSV